MASVIIIAKKKQKQKKFKLNLKKEQNFFNARGHSP